MWQHNYYNDGSALIYYLDNFPIIEISENFLKIKRYKRYLAQVVPKDENKKLTFSDIVQKDYVNQMLDNELTDDDLDVLKFKSLLKARELGWDVDISNLK